MSFENINIRSDNSIWNYFNLLINWVKPYKYNHFL